MSRLWHGGRAADLIRLKGRRNYPALCGGRFEARLDGDQSRGGVMPLSEDMLSLFRCMIVAIGLGLAMPALPEPPKGDLNGDLIGATQIYIVQAGDSWNAIARRFDVGATELRAANPGLNASLSEGAVLTVPLMHILPSAPRTGIVIDRAHFRLFYYAADGTVMTFPISVGREGWHTPTGATSVVVKRINPTWTVPPSIRAENPRLPAVVPPGPKNPLGHFALNLGWPGYAIHGTNAPSSIGKAVSHGCIRMYPEDIERLFAAVPVGTPVMVVDEPVKLGRSADGGIFIETAPRTGPPETDSPAAEGQAARLAQSLGNETYAAAVLSALLLHDGLTASVDTPPQTPQPSLPEN